MINNTHDVDFNTPGKWKEKETLFMGVTLTIIIMNPNNTKLKVNTEGEKL